MPGNSIFSDIQDVWDANKEDSRINLALWGSIYSKMKKIFDDKDEPLYGRATARFNIRAFSTKTLEVILKDHNPDFTPDDMLTLYMVTGGYLDKLETGFNIVSRVRSFLQEISESENASKAAASKVRFLEFDK